MGMNFPFGSAKRSGVSRRGCYEPCEVVLATAKAFVGATGHEFDGRVCRKCGLEVPEGKIGTAIPCADEPRLQPGDPNPANFRIERTLAANGLVAAKIVWPDAANYDGVKIAVYACTLAELASATRLDPHFAEVRGPLSADCAIRTHQARVAVGMLAGVERATMKFYIRKSWGCIVGHGIPGTSSAYVTTDGLPLRQYNNNAKRAFTEDEARAYLASHKDPGVYLTVEVDLE